MSRKHWVVPAVLVCVGMFLVWGSRQGAAVATFAPTPQVALLTHDLPAGTDAGTNTGGGWTTRALNTQVYDPAHIVTLAGNQFTLREGTYLLQSDQTIFGAHGIPKSFRGRLRNVSNNTTVATSLNVRLHEELNESASITCPIPPTLITVNQNTTFELQYYCETADANSWALGLGMATGEVERTASVFIQKLN